VPIGLIEEHGKGREFQEEETIKGEGGKGKGFCMIGSSLTYLVLVHVEKSAKKSALGI